jgi:hypothetical protein
MPLLDDIIDHPVLGREFRRGLEEGRKQGLELRFQQDRHGAAVKLVLLQFEKRFGEVPASLRERLARMTSTEAEDVALRLLDASGPDELLS